MKGFIKIGGGVTSVNVSPVISRELETKRVWSAECVRSFCMRNNYYNSGNTADYDGMLEFVDNHDATPINVFRVARNILLHTNAIKYITANEVVNLMEHLDSECVTTQYTFDQDFTTEEETKMEENNTQENNTPNLITPLEMVQKLMKELGVKVSDFPEYKGKVEAYSALFNKYLALRRLAKDILWQKFLDEMGNDAYDWAEGNIPEEWREELEIHRKLYKVVRVSAEFTVVIPNDDEDYNWEDYVDRDNIDFDYHEEDSDLTEDDVDKHYRPINEIEDLD